MEHATNLKEMYMDDSIFWVDYVDEHDEVLDLENDVHSNIFLLYKLSSSKLFLERINSKCEMGFRWNS